MHKILNAQIPEDDGEKADHDFDVVTHNFCNYKDDGKGLQIDVEKIVGDAADGVSIFWYSNFKTFIATVCPHKYDLNYLKYLKCLPFNLQPITIGGGLRIPNPRISLIFA